MSLESLKENIKYEKEIINEVALFSSQLEQAKLNNQVDDEKLLGRTITSLFKLLEIINKSLPQILMVLGVPEQVETKVEKEELKDEGLIRVSYNFPSGKKYVTINKKDKEKFINELSLSFSSIKKLGKAEKVVGVVRVFKKPSLYAKFSNRFFSNLSNLIVGKGYFKDLNVDLRKANLPYLLNTYISMGLMSAVLGAVVGLISFVVILFFVKDFLIYLLLILGLPLLTLASFYFYPYLEKGNIEKRTNQELPFVVIHMSAIAGSKIEPSQIFKIIALGGEYPYSNHELKKVINQVNVYGYDLVNALKNAARSTASKKFGELFNGLATTISSGGNLNEFLEKRAESLLFEYRLERERFTRTAETFMDIYISVVIAAPMIMMLMLILISISGISIGLSIFSLSLIIVLIVSLINVIFLVILHIKQPSY